MATRGEDTVLSVATNSGAVGEKGANVAEKGSSSDSENSEGIRQRILDQQAEVRNESRLATNLASLWTRSKNKQKPEDIATQPSVFDDPALAKYFRKSQCLYEGPHDAPNAVADMGTQNRAKSMKTAIVSTHPLRGPGRRRLPLSDGLTGK